MTLFVFALVGQAVAAPTVAQAPSQRSRTGPIDAATPPALGEAAGVESAPIVTAVELHHPEGFDGSALVPLISLQPGGRLSRREVQRSIERLFATGRLADVVAKRFDVGPNTVRVVFEVSPVRRIASVYVQGNTVFSESAVTTASGLEADTDFFPEKLERAKEGVKRLYERRGYRRVEVRTEVTERELGNDILLSVEEGSPSRVLGVVLSGGPGLPLDKLLQTLGVRAGDVLDAEVLEPGVERLRELYRAQGFFQARVGEPEVTNEGLGVRVAIPVDAGPRFVFHFRGNQNFSNRVLTSVLDYNGSESLDRSVTSRLARKIENFYRYRGFYDVRVRPREVSSPNGARAVLSFDIDEGRPLFVETVNFQGNASIGDARLRDILTQTVRELTPQATGSRPLDDPLETEGRTGEAKYLNPQPDPSTVYVGDAYRDAVGRMANYYRSRGYPQAKVVLEGADIDTRTSAVRARIRVEEGPRARIQRVTEKGLPPSISLGRTRSALIGTPLVPERVEAERNRVARALSQQGFIFARLEVTSGLEGDGTRAAVHFDVTPGPQVRVGRIILQGLVRSQDGVVRKNLPIEEGALLDPELLYTSQRNLVALGIFRSVTVRVLAPDTAEETKDVVVELRERPRLSGEFGGGYSLEDGPRILLDGVYPNLTGSGINVSLRGKLNYVPGSFRALSGNINSQGLEGIQGFGGRGVLSFYQPRIYNLLPLQVGARLDLVAERVQRPFYRFSRYAVIAGLDWNALDWLTFTLQYEIENDRVFTQEAVNNLLSTARPVEEQRFLFEPGVFSLQSLRPGVTIDLRDDPTKPTKGLLVSGLSELTKDLGATLTLPGQPAQPVDIYTLKLSGSVTGYIPMPSKMVLALSLRGGKIFRLDPESRTVGPKRFFLGGASSMRGFQEDAVVPEDRRRALREELRNCLAIVGPGTCTPNAQTLRAGRNIFSGGGEVFTLAKAELRIPLKGSLDLGLFFEAGNLWLDPAEYEVWVLRYIAGMGFRYNTPIGPLAFDLGVNLDRDNDVNESGWALHFSIGLF